jgi:hypothetical protein
MHTRSLVWPSLLLIISVAGLLLFKSRAEAGMRVIQSNSPQYPVGTVLEDAPRLGVGCYVRILTPAGETELIEGQKRRELPGGVTRGRSSVPC